MTFRGTFVENEINKKLLNKFVRGKKAVLGQLPLLIPSYLLGTCNEIFIHHVMVYSITDKRTINVKET